MIVSLQPPSKHDILNQSELQVTGIYDVSALGTPLVNVPSQSVWRA